MKYEIQIASDIIRDGLGVELVKKDSNSYETVAEIFRCDKDNSIIINTFNNDIDLQSFLMLMKSAKERLHTFEDGTKVTWDK